MLKKFLYRCYLLSFPIWMTILFGIFVIWHPSISVETPYMIILMIAYFICLGVLYVTYYGNKIGVYRILEIIYSNFLSLLFTDVIFGFVLAVLVESIQGWWNFILFFIVQFLIMSIWVITCNKIYTLLYGCHRILLISDDEELAQVLENKLHNRKNRFYVKEIVFLNQGTDFVFERCKEYGTIMVSSSSAEFNAMIANYCFENGKQLFMVPSIPGIIYRGMSPLHIIDTPIYTTNKYVMTLEQAVVKRIFDILISGVAAILLSPFMLVTAVAIKLQDGGPVLYKQKRLTKDGKEFYVYKFRSMIVDAEKNSGARLSSGENDERITKVGKIIRAIRFDELPQLLNILKGDMSIVGPRPERPEIAEQYYKVLPEFKYRLKVKAGLTGYAQVYGKYNTTPEDKLKLDLMYINNYSLYQDLKIMFYTVKILFMKDSTEGIEEGKTTAA